MASSAAVRYCFALFLIISFALDLVSASGHGHHHGHHQHKRANGPLSDAEVVIKNAHKAIAAMNKGRVLYPQYNTYELQPESAGSEPLNNLAQILEYNNGSSIDAAKLRRRQNSTSAQPAQWAYRVPPELAEAARIVAEANPEPIPGDYGIDLAAELGQYRPRTNNDTNRPTQRYRASNGLDTTIPANLTVQNPAPGTQLRKRATTDFWMTTMEQRGASPFAPEGYKVWRNVKDYGAKGDGMTDDTRAINLAISDGNRCGVNCGSSTIRPAFVYFPPGIYLVSSSIIQYYNTEFYGNPFDWPTILAASSFVGLGVITSDVYLNDDTQWYLNTNNFLRSIRNFKMDITRTDPYAYVCAIHWQVAQGTSLENIEFYMKDDEETTQQGIYMENGSGGFLTNLTFVGGNFGAYFGNQQFTTTQLSFVRCKTALQIHWDWAWTMQDVVITSCTNGIVIVGGAGGPGSTGQSVGSLMVLDAVFAFTKTAIVTSLHAENSTSFLLQNAQFLGVDTAVKDSVQDRTLLAGGLQVVVGSWGFGLVASTSTNSVFYNGDEIPAMNRTGRLTASDGYNLNNLFQRRRPAYTDIGMSQIMDVKEWGAVGDGEADDGPVLNSILDRAANMSAIVYFPFGVYIIRDTLHVPVGSRIIGQVWSQIMAKGPKFQNELQPKVAVRVGRPGDVGIIEIQSMMFTVSGPTAGAVLVEWNVHESTQGSAGMWDSHFRVGGATGSLLRSIQCPKNSGTVKNQCKGASLLLHLTPQSSAYLENIWAWTADHDLDIRSQDQIDVYTARGILVESQGPTWMYGTSSEHNILYQYQVSGAKDLYMGMLQAESPYFQPVPKAPRPYSVGLFPNDPTFADCDADSTDLTCAMSWALRIIDSESIYIMGAGVYSWFSDYTQECVDKNDCQRKAVYIAGATDTWLYNLVSKGVVEMVSARGEPATLATNNINGFMSSILAWVRDGRIGSGKFPGFQVHRPEWLGNLTQTCKTALTQKIMCHNQLRDFQTPMVGQYIENSTIADLVCDEACGDSLKLWYDNVSSNCGEQRIGRAVATLKGGYIWSGYNLTCLKDRETDAYCPAILWDFTTVPDVQSMPEAEMCSYCFSTMLQMRQESPYALYEERDQQGLQLTHATCGLTGPTDLHPPLFTKDPLPPTTCTSGTTHIVSEGETCDDIALQYSVASATIHNTNADLIWSCSELIGGRKICIPLGCDRTYTVKDDDSCYSIDVDQQVPVGTVQEYNRWIDTYCMNLQAVRETLGSVICVSPQGGTHNSTLGDSTGSEGSGGSSTMQGGGYGSHLKQPPANATLAEGTTRWCTTWYTAVEGDRCAVITVQNGIPASLLLEVNPSLARADCDGSLVEGLTYCVAPFVFWDDPDLESEMKESSIGEYYEWEDPLGFAVGGDGIETASDVDG
ncbi:pectin lyase-like protein [Aspergillus californicus]